MDAREVRIGNYVKYENKVYQIDTISKELPTLNTIEFGIGVVEWKDLQPIKFYAGLWEDIGLQTNIFAERSRFIIYKNGNEFIFEYDDCEYLHELQNLYFALTRKELNIKL